MTQDNKLNTERILHQQIDYQRIKKFRAFMEPEDSLPYLQDLAIGSYP
jgi:hypothetical protein